MTFPPGLSGLSGQAGPPGGQFGPAGQQVPPPWDPRGFGGPIGGPPGPHPGGPAAPMTNGPWPYQPGPQQPGAYGGQPWQSGPPGASPAAKRSGQWVLFLRIIALVLVVLGLSIPFDSNSDWVSRTTWAIFAALAAFTQLLASAGGAFSWNVRQSWLIGAVATGALTLHWLLIALPSVGSNSGFCLTFGTAAAVGAMLLAPGRRW